MLACPDASGADRLGAVGVQVLSRVTTDLMLIRSFAQAGLDNPPAGGAAAMPGIISQGNDLSRSQKSWAYSVAYMPGRDALADWSNKPQHTADLLDQISRLDMAFRSLQESYGHAGAPTLLYIGLEDPEDILDQQDPATQAGTYAAAAPPPPPLPPTPLPPPRTRQTVRCVERMTNIAL